MRFLIPALLLCAAAVSADDSRVDPERNAALAVSMGDRRDGLRRNEFLSQFLATPGVARPKRRKTLDLTPLAEMAIGYAKSLGVPLIEQRNAKGSPVAVSARFSLAEDTPQIRVHLGDIAPEPFGAFFPSEKGFRLSVIYPVHDLTLRVEAGEDSEFGNVAIAGLQWVHPNQRLAAGFGMPVRMSNSDGAIGAIFQIRVKLK